ncbi:hypothetical protein ZWY2020_042419 [Hordeum vulgare]|nr:hypothetical protein ZWY2020_042419 [Hordeum vulgare]
MDVATGAMDSLLPKLGELLMEEYMLHARVKKDVQRLRTELTVMYAALREGPLRCDAALPDGPGGGGHLISSPDLDPRDDVGSLCKAVACGKGNCTVTEVSRKDSRSTLPDPWGRSYVHTDLLDKLYFLICCSEHTYEGHYSRYTSSTEAQGVNIGVCKGC